MITDYGYLDTRRIPIFTAWVNASHRFSLRDDPFISVRIQNSGAVDCMLREAEDRVFKAVAEAKDGEFPDADLGLWLTISRMWAVDLCDVLRIAAKRGILPPEMAKAEKVIKGLRIALSKHEVGGEVGVIERPDAGLHPDGGFSWTFRPRRNSGLVTVTRRWMAEQVLSCAANHPENG